MAPILPSLKKSEDETGLVDAQLGPFDVIDLTNEDDDDEDETGIVDAQLAPLHAIDYINEDDDYDDEFAYLYS